METWPAGMYVWVDLGGLHGWWPAIYQPLSFKPPSQVFEDLIINESVRKSEATAAASNSSAANNKPVICFARFFDDDKFDLFPIRDPKNIKPYSCSHKLNMIRFGLKRFEPKPEKRVKRKRKRGRKSACGKENDDSKNRGLFDLRIRLAQFYKDVELAEVMTDQDSRVGNILLEYEVEGENCAKLSSEDDNNHVESVESPKKIVNVLHDGTVVNNTGKRLKVE